MHRQFLPIGLFVSLCVPAFATVQIVSMLPSLVPPRSIGSSIVWTVSATDTSPGPLTFQFNVAHSDGSLTLAKDFNVGTLAAGVWTSLPFVWVPTSVEGTYRIQVVVKDFATGETASQTVQYQVNPLVTGNAPVVVPTANPLVALFSAPSCASGSSMRVVFQIADKKTPASATTMVSCHPPYTMTFEIAGMYPNSIYEMSAETATGSQLVNGPVTTFTTGALPADISFPEFGPTIQIGPQTDTSDPIILHNLFTFGEETTYPDVATDLVGRILWYYYPNDTTHINVLTRPLQNGGFLSIEDDPAWNPAATKEQLLRRIDLAGNVVRETNTGAIQQQLLALGAANGGPCNVFPSPPPVGSACLGGFHHDAIQTLPNGYTAVLADIEKIFPAGIQGDTSGLPVDVIGDMIVILDDNWQVVWYFDSFQHAGGGNQLFLDRPAVLGETCVADQKGCPPIFLLGPGIAPLAHDWLHGNSLYYWPQDHDIVFSMRNQDWVVKIDYNDGAGTRDILWRMGVDGDFMFKNPDTDPWPWFSHQHDAGMENAGQGPLTIFDNGNTRVSPPPLGLGSGNSRGMALTVDEQTMQVTPVLSVDLGVYSQAMGSAQLLSDGDYFFLPALVLLSSSHVASFSIEIYPTSGTITGTQVLNLEGPEQYRAWQMLSLYGVPIT
ncbi:MAG: aryl-sulfate sulfotransferase [Bryobacteraceae bacterium]|jgi:hypothetical protein